MTRQATLLVASRFSCATWKPIPSPASISSLGASVTDARPLHAPCAPPQPPHSTHKRPLCSFNNKSLSRSPQRDVGLVELGLVEWVVKLCGPRACRSS
eukprot:7757186-Pyramimonas_sp.AAC.1